MAAQARATDEQRLEELRPVLAGDNAPTVVQAAQSEPASQTAAALDSTEETYRDIAKNLLPPGFSAAEVGTVLKDEGLDDKEIERVLFHYGAM